MGVVLFNFGEDDFAIKEGDRIAQLVLEKVYMCDAEEVKVRFQFDMIAYGHDFVFDPTVDTNEETCSFNLEPGRN